MLRPHCYLEFYYYYNIDQARCLKTGKIKVYLLSHRLKIEELCYTNYLDKYTH